MTRILMVCLGNICRSPLAEGIMQSKFPREVIKVDSAGTGSYHIGESPDPRSIAVARKYGINISTQKCRQFEVEDFDLFDHILVMDNSNFEDVIKQARTAEDMSKVTLILDQLQPNRKLEVPDPYYGSENGFEKVYDLLNKACDAFIEKLS